MSAEELTKQQRRAMGAFLWRDTFDTQAFDGSVWDQGVRPWPTMANLAKKGLVEAVAWIDPDTGWEYRLTELGRAYMESVVAAGGTT